jgi:hypothetical protein
MILTQFVMLSLTDVDECNVTATNTCDINTEECENTEGSFRCNCKPGYRKVGSTCQGR